MVGSNFVLTLFCNSLDATFPKPHCMKVRNMYSFLGQVDAVISQAKRKTKQKSKVRMGESK